MEALDFFYSDQSHKTTSYKYVFLKSIIVNAHEIEGDSPIRYQRVFDIFTEIYWLLVRKFQLKQGPQNTAVENIICDYSMIGPATFIEFDSLPSEDRSQLVVAITKECKKYVLGALFHDLKQLFYSFDNANETIVFNPRAIRFIRKYRDQLDERNDRHLLAYLRKNNPERICNENLVDAIRRY